MSQVALSQLERVLEACGGVASLAEVQQEFKKMFPVDFDDKWRKMHFGYEDLDSLAKIDSFDKVISLTRCEDLFFIEKPDKPQVTKVKKSQPEPTTISEAQLKEALAFCRGTATLKELRSAFQNLFNTSFDKSWCKKNYGVKALSAVISDPRFPPYIKVEQCPKGKDHWIFRNVAQYKAEVPVKLKLKQQGLSHLLQALDYFGGFCKFRQLEKYFASYLKLDLDTAWTLKHFGVEDLDSFAALPEISAKVLIWPKDEKKQQYYFQLNGADRGQAGVSQLKDALGACGGAATLEQMKEKFREKFYTPCGPLWMKLMFGVDTYDILESFSSFKRFVRLFPKPEWIFRLRKPFSQKPSAIPLQVSAQPKQLLWDKLAPETVAQGRKEILAVFDEFDGECVLDDFLREYARQFSGYLNDKQYFRGMNQIGAFLGQEVIIDKSRKNSGLPMKMTLVNKEYEGRRRLLIALKAGGSCCSIDELNHCYSTLFQSSVVSEMKEYFGASRVEEAIPKFSKQMLVIRKFSDSQLIFIMKPVFTGLKRPFSNYARSVEQHITGDIEIFKHQCIFLSRNVQSVVRRLGKNCSFDDVCRHFFSTSNIQQIGELLKATSPKLLRFMVPEVAWLFPVPEEKSPSPVVDRGDSQDAVLRPEEGDVIAGSKNAWDSVAQTTRHLSEEFPPITPGGDCVVASEGMGLDRGEGLGDGQHVPQKSLLIATPTAVVASNCVGVVSGDGSAEEFKECEITVETQVHIEASLPQLKRGIRRLIRSFLCLKKSPCTEDDLRTMYRSLHGVDLDAEEVEKLFGVRSLPEAAGLLSDYVSITEVPLEGEKEEDLVVLKRLSPAVEGRGNEIQGKEGGMTDSGISRLFAALDACSEGSASLKELEHSYFTTHGVVLDETELQKHFGTSSMAEVVMTLVAKNQLLATVVHRRSKVSVGNRRQYRVLCQEVPPNLYSCVSATPFEG